MKNISWQSNKNAKGKKWMEEIEKGAKVNDKIPRNKKYFLFEIHALFLPFYYRYCHTHCCVLWKLFPLLPFFAKGKKSWIILTNLLSLSFPLSLPLPSYRVGASSSLLSTEIYKIFSIYFFDKTIFCIVSEHDNIRKYKECYFIYLCISKFMNLIFLIFAAAVFSIEQNKVKS